MIKQVITLEDIRVIIDTLWQTDNPADNPPVVYAVLDGARDKKIHKMVKESGLRNSCLYDGKLSYELAAAAPYLIRLEKDHPFVVDLIHQAWGNSWGIFLKTDNKTTLLSVRRNCKKIAFVRDEQKRKLLFRYYDPRVLRTFLPTCREDELKQIFGPIASYLIEDETATALHRYSQQETGFKQRKIKLLTEPTNSMTA